MHKPFLARVSDSSLAPAYRPGDVVVFDPAVAPKPGDACLVVFAATAATTFRLVSPARTASGQPGLALFSPASASSPVFVPSRDIAAVVPARALIRQVNDRPPGAQSPAPSDHLLSSRPGRAAAS